MNLPSTIEELENVVTMALGMSGNNEQIKLATSILNEILKSPTCVQQFITLIGQSNTAGVRNLSAVLLRRKNC